MKQRKILHLFCWDVKFVPPFIDFMRSRFDDGAHTFIICGDVREQDLADWSHTSSCPNVLNDFFKISIEMHKADKVILHGLFNGHLIYILALQSWLLKKCHWVIWGGDLYKHDLNCRGWRWYKDELLRNFVIARMGHLVTYVRGDYELARKWYGARGSYYECIMYQSNLCKEYEIPQKTSSSLTILIGNSADPANNHIEVFAKLLRFKDEDIRIIVPLSYGNEDYAKDIADTGRNFFGEKLSLLTELIPFQQYLELLGEVDIAVFNHKRQQAMGNIITLLGLGKTVYMRKDISSWSFLTGKGIKVFDVEKLGLVELSYEDKQENIKRIKGYFSPERLEKQLRGLLA